MKIELCVNVAAVAATATCSEECCTALHSATARKAAAGFAVLVACMTHAHSAENV